MSFGAIEEMIATLKRNARPKREGYKPDQKKHLFRREADPAKLEEARQERESHRRNAGRLRIIIFLFLIISVLALYLFSSRVFV